MGSPLQRLSTGTGGISGVAAPWSRMGSPACELWALQAAAALQGPPTEVNTMPPPASTGLNSPSAWIESCSGLMVTSASSNQCRSLLSWQAKARFHLSHIIRSDGHDKPHQAMESHILRTQALNLPASHPQLHTSIPKACQRHVARRAVDIHRPRPCIVSPNRVEKLSKSWPKLSRPRIYRV